MDQRNGVLLRPAGQLWSWTRKLQNERRCLVASLTIILALAYILYQLRVPLSTAQISPNDCILSLGHLERCYIRYKEEIISLRLAHHEYCSKASLLEKKKMTSHVILCLTGAAEVELLYLRIRHSKPQRVLELASAWGGTTLALLAALNINKDKGTLIGVDVLVEHQLYLHEMRDVLNKYFGKFGFDNKMIRFDFIFGDIKLHLPDINKVPFDYIHIDGDHSAQFAQLYTENILDKNQRRYLLSIHDIISCDCNPGRLSLTEEGQVVMDWLELCGDRNDFPKRLFSQCKDYILHNELQKVRKKVFEGSSVLLNKNESIWSTCQTTQRGDYMSTIYTQVERIQE